MEIPSPPLCCCRIEHHDKMLFFLIKQARDWGQAWSGEKNIQRLTPGDHPWSRPMWEAARPIYPRITIASPHTHGRPSSQIQPISIFSQKKIPFPISSLFYQTKKKKKGGSHRVTLYCSRQPAKLRRWWKESSQQEIGRASCRERVSKQV